MPPSPIHVLGIGNLGKLLAHSLRRRHPETPITLLFHRPTLVDEWERAGQCIEIVRNGKADKQDGFHFETVAERKGDIENLVVATKTHSTVQALRPLRERLAVASTLLFLQNGIGTTDEVATQLFPQLSSRPNLLTGIFNHGVYAKSQFSSVHIGLASAFIGPTPSTRQETTMNGQASSSFLAERIIECPELTASYVSSQEILHVQLQKLVVNAVINPLTSIFDCLNGELFQSAAIQTLIDGVIAEISTVVLSILTGENEQIDPDVKHRFSPGNLTQVVYDVGDQTSKNISSMRQDVLAGRTTEIDYINGYIVHRGTELGIPIPINAKIVALVKKKRLVSEDQILREFLGSSF